MSQSAKVGSQIYAVAELPVSLVGTISSHPVPCFSFLGVHVLVIRMRTIVLSIQILSVGLCETMCVRRAYQVVAILLFVTVNNAGQ